MGWQLQMLDEPIQIISLKAGNTVFGIYKGLIASPKFPNTRMVVLERPEGGVFAFASGLILTQWLSSIKRDLVGQVISVKRIGTKGRCDTYKVGLWTDDLSSLMKDETYVELNMRLNSILERK